MSAKNDWGKITNIFAFIAVILIGIVLLLLKLGIDLGDVSNILSQGAQLLAYFVVAVCSFFYAYGKWNRKQIWYLICWIIAVVLIVVSYVL